MANSNFHNNERAIARGESRRLDPPDHYEREDVDMKVTKIVIEIEHPEAVEPGHILDLVSKHMDDIDVHMLEEEGVTEENADLVAVQSVMQGDDV